LLAERILGFEKDPLGFVYFAFPWGENGSELERNFGPREWQADVLTEIRDAYAKGEAGNASKAFRMAARSGRGIGKSALISWLILWAMSTRRNTKCRVTASTEQQLRTTTWPELNKWCNMSINSHWWRQTGTALVANDPDGEKRWRVDAVTWSDTNTVAFQGLHNQGSRLALFFDEASGIHDDVWDVTEGSMAREDTDILWFAFGNPNYNKGAFNQCWGRYRKVWRKRTINAKEVEGSNKDQIKEWEDTKSEDWCRVHIYGQPPLGAGGNLIGVQLVEEAVERRISPHQYEFAPMVLGVDPSWTGDDSLEVVARQGNWCKCVLSIPKNDDDVAVSNEIARVAGALGGVDAIFVDGGFGTGIYSILKSQGFPVHIVWFASKSLDEECVNKRAEMWKGVREWLKDGGVLPDDEELKSDLWSQGRKSTADGRILLKSKEEMKKEGLASPNKGDALALTFAMPIVSRNAVKAISDMDFEGEFDGIW
jgi:hypothetical protein